MARKNDNGAYMTEASRIARFAMHHRPTPHSEILLKVRVVASKTTLSRSSIYRKVAAGHFPAPVRIPGTSRVAWRESDIDAWLAALSSAP